MRRYISAKLQISHAKEIPSVVASLSMTLNSKAAKDQFDVAIIGGGPAASAAAITCAHHGLKVVVFEALSFPRDHPGETLHPGIEALWEQLGVIDAVTEARFLRPDGYYLNREGEVNYVPYGADTRGRWRGFHAWRAELDQIMARAARQQGAEWWENCKAREVLLAGGRIVGVQFSHGSVLSRFVLDASGSAQWLPKHMGLAIRRCSEKLVVKYGYQRCQPLTSIRPSFIMRPNAWSWVAEVKLGLAAWATLTPAGLSCEVPFCSSFGETEDVSRPRGADVTWRIVAESAGPGYFVLGDAAVSLDPACSHGVLRAVSSGIMAAHQVLGIIGGNITERQGALTYSDWLMEWFQRDAKALLDQYLLHSPGLAKRVHGFIC